MRARSAVVLVALLASVAVVHVAPAAHSRTLTFAQNDGGGKGQSDPAAETGAGEGETEGAAAEENPPWTYQMARLGILLALVVLLTLGMLYYRYVITRARGEV